MDSKRAGGGGRGRQSRLRYRARARKIRAGNGLSSGGQKKPCDQWLIDSVVAGEMKSPFICTIPYGRWSLFAFESPVCEIYIPLLRETPIIACLKASPYCRVATLHNTLLLDPFLTNLLRSEKEVNSYDACLGGGPLSARSVALHHRPARQGQKHTSGQPCRHLIWLPTHLPRQLHAALLPIRPQRSTSGEGCALSRDTRL